MQEAKAQECPIAISQLLQGSRRNLADIGGGSMGGSMGGCSSDSRGDSMGGCSRGSMGGSCHTKHIDGK